MAPEVGITGVLGTPWQRRWRVDLAAVLGPKTYVIEVKGTQADLAREDLDTGKWVHNHPGLCLWLALDAKIRAPKISENWGIISVEGARIQVVRRPPLIDDDRRETSLEAIGSSLCLQSLPQMMGLSRAAQASQLANGHLRPWRHWIKDTLLDDVGHIL